jgi:hypothetical protein
VPAERNVKVWFLIYREEGKDRTLLGKGARTMLKGNCVLVPARLIKVIFF